MAKQQNLHERKRKTARNELLRDLRIARNMTLEDVSYLTGISISGLSRIEGGSRSVSRKAAYKLAVLFDVEPSTIMQLRSLEELKCWTL